MGAFTSLFIQEAKANPKRPDLPNKVILEYVYLDWAAGQYLPEY